MLLDGSSGEHIIAIEPLGRGPRKEPRMKMGEWAEWAHGGEGVYMKGLKVWYTWILEASEGLN